MWRCDLRQDRGVSWAAACAARDEAARRLREAEGEGREEKSGFYVCA